MALFGLFGKKSEADILAKHAEKVANKRAQAVDRWEAIRALGHMATPEAAEGLLARFTFYVDPSITDQEEKDAAFDAIVGAGEAAVEPVAKFLAKAESISWPVKMLDKLLEPELVIGKLLELLGTMHIEYERDPQRKIQLLATLEERSDPRIAGAVARFLEDANETVRFNAVGALYAQEDAEDHQAALIDALCQEESVRVRNRILERFAESGWKVAERADDVRGKLPGGFSLAKDGSLKKR
ncbi:MAG: HEAT repeat domain-containing protein [Myxococcales bacterium]|nr:HEAT repeat domain-containing protein [Myxococcales bacterium]